MRWMLLFCLAGSAAGAAPKGAPPPPVEDKLAEEQARRDERLRQLFLERIGARSRLRSALVSRTGRVLAASPRGWLGRRIEPPADRESLTLADGT